MICHQQGQRILVHRIGQIGDTIIALPAMWAVRSYFSSRQLCLLTDRHPQNDHVLAAHVLPREGLFDDWITYPANVSGVDPKSLLSILPELRRRRFDTLVYLAPRLRTRWQVWRDLAFFRLAGMRCFIAHRGFKPLPQSVDGGSLPVAEHEADHLLHRVSLSGIPVPPPGKGCMSLRLTGNEHEQARSWLATHLGERLDDVPLVGIGPGSKWPSKVWPEERFVALGERLVSQLGVYPIVFGGPEDHDLGQRLIARWGIGANASGELDVRQAAAALAMCSFYIGNDTGTMHLAAAVGTQCVAIFAAQDWPGRWYPYGEGHIVLRQPVPCQGCMLSICVTEGMRCLKLIEVEHVFSACRRVWEGLQTRSSIVVQT